VRDLWLDIKLDFLILIERPESSSSLSSSSKSKLHLKSLSIVLIIGEGLAWLRLSESILMFFLLGVLYLEIEAGYATVLAILVM
jgi:hypothetical protein